MESAREANARRQREFRARIRAKMAADPALRLCPYCGGPHPGGMRRCCSACREVARAARRRKTEAGLCPDCGRPKADGSMLCCAACRARRARNQVRARAENRAAGLCGCGKPLQPASFMRCAACRAYREQYKRKVLI